MGELFDMDYKAIKEFGIRIPLDCMVGSQVRAAKENVYNRHGVLPLLNSRPHVTIINILSDFSNYDRIKGVLSHTSKKASFKMKITDVLVGNTDRNGVNTIFLKIDGCEDFKKLQVLIKDGIRNFTRGKHVGYATTPHITITKCFPSQVASVLSLIDDRLYREIEINAKEVELIYRDWPGKYGWDWSKRYVVSLRK